ncbi:hypothetical protein C3492_42970 [Streptomyces sp. Ru62]|uniref:hypothetical protein n=1 Tax=Streptomyces sp. Ru62 TaxID=2080745 RepID=UPI000CDD266E|nr:hypothetical protein [Streptomyces sp. Ru62]POX57547.1 hypothetical protein C3492_42970 [Streptomyces sp. Ru62]
MTAGWCARATRAAVFAALCVLLAALGHVLMSGSDVPAWALAAGGAVTGSVGWCLAGRERGLPLIATVVVAAQAVLHEAFSCAQSMSGTSDGSASRGMSGMGSMDSSMSMGSMRTDSMDMGSMRMDSMDIGWMRTDSMDMGAPHMGHTGMSPVHHMGHSMDGGSSSSGMLAAHLLAAMLCGLWMAYGEKATFRILRATAGWLAAPLRLLLALPATPDRPRLHMRRRRSDRSPRLLLLVHAITSRGPPVATAVV